MAKWVRVDDFVKEILEEPWSLYWHEWESGTKEFEDFLLDPLSVLSKDISLVSAHAWTVSTEILNHESSLKSSIVCTILIAMPAEKRLKVLLYNHTD